MSSSPSGGSDCHPTPSTPNVKSEPPDDIKDYAETTMNELLGWYGYEKVDSRETRALNLQHFAGPPPSSPDSSPDSTDPEGPQLHPVPPSSPRSPQNSSTSTGGDGSGCIVCTWCQKLGMKLFTLRGPTGIKAFCSELCFTQCRRASFKKNKICDWCKHVRHTVNYVDFQDGEQQLQFCSDKCLNQYKMNIFCKETQAHLQLHTHLKEAVCSKNPNASGGSLNLITPDLWLKDCKSHFPGSSNGHTHSVSDEANDEQPTSLVNSSDPPQDVPNNLSVSAASSENGHENSPSHLSIIIPNDPPFLPLPVQSEKEDATPNIKLLKPAKERHHRHHHHRVSKNRSRKNKDDPHSLAFRKDKYSSPYKGHLSSFGRQQNSHSPFNGPSSNLTSPPTQTSPRPSHPPHLTPSPFSSVVDSGHPPLPPPPPLLSGLSGLLPSPLNLMTHSHFMRPPINSSMSMRPGMPLPPWMMPPLPPPPPSNPLQQPPQTTPPSLLPPVTVTVPYPIFVPIPLPIPIPIPLDVMARALSRKDQTSVDPAPSQTKKDGTAVDDNNLDMCNNEVLNLTSNNRQPVPPLKLKREAISPQDKHSDIQDYSSYSEPMSTDDESRHPNNRDEESSSPFETSPLYSAKARGWTLAAPRGSSPAPKKRCSR